MEKICEEIGGVFSGIEIPNLVYAIFETCIDKNYAVAIYKLPQEQNVTAIIDFSYTAEEGRFELTPDKSGFAVQPFIEDQGHSFINAGLQINLYTGATNCKPEFSLAATNFLEEVVKISKKVVLSEDQNFILENQSPIDDQYIQNTKNGIERIQNGEFKKVVLARKKTITLAKKISPTYIFQTLCNVQTDSFISIVKVPNESTWVGASPELLVSIDKNKIFKTVALAGTQRANKEGEISKAVWTQKEIEEQALVCRYIIGCFKKIRLREYEENGPRTVRAGSLFHLKTEYLVDLNELPFPDLATTMLGLLHPTSAVCGMPKEESLAFIRQCENLDRKFYSGYIGPVNIESESHIFVNIRCAEISGASATLYSGAGITAESDPEKELLETELKMQVMENIITQNFPK